MKAGLFVPCYIDQFYPGVAKAALTLLEKQGVEVIFPFNQTCCGQPFSNSGLESEAAALCGNVFRAFHGVDYIVSPSGSCASTLKHRSTEIPVYELCEFFFDVLQVRSFPGRFPHRVGLHQSCHGLRELRLGAASERMEARPNKVRTLLESLEGIQFVELSRIDECCGFGGTFAVKEEAVSVRMGKDRLSDHLRAGAEIITGADMSCLMHLEGLAKRKDLPFRFMHIAEILAESQA